MPGNFFYYADLFNGAFELGGTYFISRSIRKLHRDKIVRGIAWEQVAFWSIWGYWNIAYYWAAQSPFSWWAGLAVTTANTVYVSMLYYYVRREGR